jgi:hypothetical protein
VQQEHTGVAPVDNCLRERLPVELRRGR